MRGCLRVLAIMLVLAVLTALGFGFLFSLDRNQKPTSNDVFEMIIYGCSFVVCLFLFVELCKWNGRF